ncbi:hypothetical protein [Bacillus pinisoli]|uniref:hypothetical protein n=1 Tax=Bacillus pinisoli TaxID=2901866 RepID=UPI001FF237F1|nr:hypothetical protein [Bacillus pinisoli]
MTDSTFKIVTKNEETNSTTIVYLCQNDPLQDSLFQCSFSKDNNDYVVTEHLQYCMKSENFLDIQGLYSNELQQEIITALHNCS